MAGSQVRGEVAGSGTSRPVRLLLRRAVPAAGDEDAAAVVRGAGNVRSGRGRRGSGDEMEAVEATVLMET